MTRPRVLGVPLSRGRSGKTILELMVVIATSAVLVSMSAGLFYHLARSDRKFRDTASAARSQMRLARLFRSDARAADSVRLSNAAGGGMIAFLSETGQVTYAATPEGVRRAAEDEQGARRDLFRLGETSVAFSLRDGLAALSAAPRRGPPPGRPASIGSFRVVAAAGADTLDGEADVVAWAVAAPRPGGGS